MERREFARKIQLDPRASVLIGTIEPRAKKDLPRGGFTPHYATNDCPPVMYGTTVQEQPQQAEIEFMFREKDFPLPQLLGSKQGNLVQLFYGRNGQAPTQSAYRVLQEAAAVLQQASESRSDVFLVGLTIVTPGMYGAMLGKHYFLGAFTPEGVPLYLNPDAVDQGILKAAYPKEQKQRSTEHTLAHQETHWHERLSSMLSAATGLKGKPLQEAVLRARAQELVSQGRAPDVKAALEMAREDAKPPGRGQEKDQAKATPAGGDDRSLGAQMRGRERLQTLGQKAASGAEKPSQERRR